MKEYPSINNPPNFDDYFYGFVKYDGQHIRVTISRKNGCIKFGSKKILIDESTPILGESINLIKNKYEKDLQCILKDLREQEADFYFEFFGPNSQFGQHINEQHDVILFDCYVPKQGIIEPKIFIKKFGHLHIPELIHQGKVNKEIIEKIKKKEIENVGNEGIVFKGQQDRKTQIPYMFKIKTYEWLEKLKQYCNGDQIKFKELE
ncbi:MAG: hypothetical protein LC122_02625 [Chitinophagales bacterium]|nr:hypothetical protein [Chitinophagales bacterium]